MLPVEVSVGGRQWIDPYAYLKDPSHEETISYVAAEQDYFVREAENLRSLQREFVTELNDALPVLRRTRAVRTGGYMVYAEVAPGAQYPVYHRYRPDDSEAVEVLLDVNLLAGGSEYFALGGFATLNSRQLIAYTSDMQGNQRYRLQIRQITGDLLPVIVDDVDADIVWLEENLLFTRNRCLYLLKPFDGAYRELNCIEDPAFHLALQTFDDRVALVANSPETTLVMLVDRDGSVQPLTDQHAGHRYSLHRHAGKWFALTNWRNASYELALVTEGSRPDAWEYLDLPGEGQLLDVEFTGDVIAIHRRSNMRDTLLLDSGEVIAQSVPGESLRLRRAADPNAIEYVRRSFLQSDRYFAFEPVTGDSTMVMQAPMAQPVDVDSFVVETRSYESGNARVPVTLLYKKGKGIEFRPLLLSVYGAYGITTPVSFDPTRFPLLERGFVLGIVHVRGGGALGPAWHEAGKGINKPNSFADFIAVTEGLIDDGVGDAGRVAAIGTSAGGTVVAVAANRRPELYRAMVMRVPFVDVTGSLLDDGQLLTASDWSEWGNPTVPAELELMRSFSPYDQVMRQAYPNMLITAAVNDSRVPYHESVKWMAKLREHHTGSARLLLSVNHNQGHSGATDQYSRRQTRGLEYAFLTRSLTVQ